MLRSKLPAGFVVPAQPVERAAPPSGADCPIGIVRVSHWSAAVSGGPGRLRSRDRMPSREVAGHRREATMSGVEDNGHDSGHGKSDAIDPEETFGQVMGCAR